MTYYSSFPGQSILTPGAINVPESEDFLLPVCTNRDRLAKMLTVLWEGRAIPPVQWDDPDSESPSLSLDHMTDVLEALAHINRPQEAWCYQTPEDEPPFYDNDDNVDGDDVEGVDFMPEAGFWDNAADWVISGFLAVTFTPGAAIAYNATIPRIRLAFRQSDFGALVRVFINSLEIWSGDTSAGQASGFLETTLDVIEFLQANEQPTDQYQLRIEHAGSPIQNLSGAGVAVLEVVRGSLVPPSLCDVYQQPPTLQQLQEDYFACYGEEMPMPGIQDVRLNGCLLEALVNGEWVTKGELPQASGANSQMVNYVDYTFNPNDQSSNELHIMAIDCETNQSQSYVDLSPIRRGLAESVQIIYDNPNSYLSVVYYGNPNSVDYPLPSTGTGVPGAPGADGASVELRVQDGFIQWRQDDDSPTWTNLIALETLRGLQGLPGIQGPPGEQGLPGEDGEDCDCGIQVVEVPIIPGQTTEQRACNIAGRLANDVLKEAAQEASDYFDGIIDNVSLVINITAGLVALAGGVGAALSAIAAAAAAQLLQSEGNTYDDVLGENGYWSNLACAIQCVLLEDGRITEANFPAVVQAVRDTLPSAQPLVAGYLADYLQALGAGVASQATVTGVFVAYDCSGCDCEEEPGAPEIVQHPATATETCTTSVLYELGASYEVTVSGVFVQNTSTNPPVLCDGFFRSTNGGTSWDQGAVEYAQWRVGTTWNDLVPKPTVKQDSYTFTITPAAVPESVGSPFCFRNNGALGNNSGFLTFSIHKLP